MLTEFFQVTLTSVLNLLKIEKAEIDAEGPVPRAWEIVCFSPFNLHDSTTQRRTGCSLRGSRQVVSAGKKVHRKMTKNTIYKSSSCTSHNYIHYTWHICIYINMKVYYNKCIYLPEDIVFKSNFKIFKRQFSAWCQSLRLLCNTWLPECM